MLEQRGRSWAERLKQVEVEEPSRRADKSVGSPVGHLGLEFESNLRGSFQS